MTRPMRNGFIDTDWRSEGKRAVVADKLPVIEPPRKAGMTAAQRMELKALAERICPTYGSFARTARAMDDLVEWIDAYKGPGA